MKVCANCKQEKSLLEFGIERRAKDGHCCYCRECAREKSRTYRNNNLERVTASKQKWNDKNPEYKKSYYQQNKETVLDKHKTYRLENLESLREYDKIRNKKRKSEVNQHRKKRYHSDSMHKLKVNIRTRICSYIKKDGITTIDLIGCSYDQLKKHLESQFKPGMTWDNHGKNGWHIDHIFPLAKAKDKEHLYSLCHYTNLQPLWWYDNLSKSDKLPEQMMNEITS